MIDSNVRKICNFYVGEGHFLTTVIPYLILKAETNNRIILICDDVENLEKNIDMFIKKYFIDFYESFCENVSIITPKSLNSRDIGMANIICIKDGFKYNILDTLILYINIELIRCYPLEFKDVDISCLIKENEFILNTKGLFKTNEVFSLRDKIGNRNKNIYLI